MMNVRLTPIVLNLLIVNVLVYLLILIVPAINRQAISFENDYLVLNKTELPPIRVAVAIDGEKHFIPRKYKLSAKEAQDLVDRDPQSRAAAQSYPRADKFIPIQVLTWFFAHKDLFHLLFNMIVLVSIGPIMENIFGPKRFLYFYFFCGIAGGLMVAFLDPSLYPVLGASGAIFGLVLAFAMYFPNQKFLLFFILPVTAKKLVVWAGIISAGFIVLDYTGFEMSRLGFMGRISHFGHLAGMIAALIFFYLEKLIARRG